MLKKYLSRNSLSLIVMTGLVVSVGLFAYVLRLDRTGTESRFYEMATPRLAAVKANISTAIDLVVMLGGHFAVEPPAQTSRAEFTTLATPSWQRHPYVQALAGVAYVKRDDRAGLEKLIRERDADPDFIFTERGADGKMHPDSQRDEYFTVLYEVPKAGNEAAFGYNLGSDPVKMIPIDKARDTGTLVATPRIKLVQGASDQYGVLLFNPIYAKGALETVEDRRAHFLGFAQGVFRIGDLISLAGQNSADASDLPIDVHVFDMAAKEDSRQLFPKTPEVTLASLQGGLFAQASIDMGGREWKIVVTPNAGFPNPAITFNALIALAAGLLATVGISLYVKQGQERLVSEALFQTNQQLEAQQSELERQSAQLEKATWAANAANAAKSEFLSSMSHELRTPLHAIIGFSELLLGGRNTGFSDKHKQQIQQINKAGEYLLYLINEILEFTKVEAGVISIAEQDVSLREILNDCRELAEPIMAKYGVTLSDETAADLPMVRIDPGRGQQIIINLLSNAAKYNKPGGTVRIEAGLETPGFVSLSVIDSGIGIDPARLPELFMPFNRLGAEATTIEGSGIGLALVRKLIEMMGGTVSCESTLGVGSRFTLTIPLALAQNRPVAELGMSPELVQPQTDPHRLAPVADHGIKTLLYIEDNPANIQLMQDFIANFPGWQLTNASSAEQGLDLAGLIPFDLIICDINLPGMSGLDAVGQLRRQPTYAATPILALSADATEQTIELALLAGFTDYLTKPIRLRDLEKHIARQIKAA